MKCLTLKWYSYIREGKGKGSGLICFVVLFYLFFPVHSLNGGCTLSHRNIRWLQVYAVLCANVFLAQHLPLRAHKTSIRPISAWLSELHIPQIPYHNPFCVNRYLIYIALNCFGRLVFCLCMGIFLPPWILYVFKKCLLQWDISSRSYRGCVGNLSSTNT